MESVVLGIAWRFKLRSGITLFSEYRYVDFLVARMEFRISAFSGYV